MSSFILNWTPAGGITSTGQQVQYKLSTASTWTTAATVSAGTNTYTATGLWDNTIYDFQIVNLCSLGGPTSGTNFQTINIVCPTVTITPTYNSVSFSFAHPGASITEYRVDLLDNAGTTVIAFKNITPSGGTVSDSFLGLTAATNYKLKLTVKAGTYSKACPVQSFSSEPFPTCDAPTALTVTIS